MDRSQREGIEPEEIWAQESVEEGRTSNKRRSTPVERPAPTHWSETTDNFAVKDKSEPRLISTSLKVPLFRQNKISVAVDVSGNTYCSVLEAEVKAIRNIYSLFLLALRSTIKILPWSDNTERPKSLDNLHELDSNGGTDPTCLVDDDICRLELQNASFRFLMTDGDIVPEEVRKFIINPINYGLHRRQSVVAIFRERELLPTDYNISIGLLVLLLAPLRLFVQSLRLSLRHVT
jgi:hypothetical protein